MGAQLSSLLEEPKRVGPYTLIQKLGQGGMAEVYLACKTGASGSREFVAVKVILPHLRSHPEFEKMLVREAAIAANLDHPNIVRDIGYSGSMHYIAMEYVDGEPLRALMRKAFESGSVPLGTSLSIFYALCRALHRAHEARDERGRPLGIVHRDVTPSNVLIEYDGTVKLADFGIAKTTARVRTTIGGSLKGKVGYISPEQCRCEQLDRRSDVFSLGVLLYELTVGRRMFTAANEFAVMGKLLRGEFPRPRDTAAGYPTLLDTIVAKATAVEPRNRYQTAAEFGAAIAEFSADHAIELSPAAVRRAMDHYFPPVFRTPVEWLAARAEEDLDGDEHAKTTKYSVALARDKRVEQYAAAVTRVEESVEQNAARSRPIVSRPRRHPAWLWMLGGVALALGSSGGTALALRPASTDVKTEVPTTGESMSLDSPSPSRSSFASSSPGSGNVGRLQAAGSGAELLVLAEDEHASKRGNKSFARNARKRRARSRKKAADRKRGAPSKTRRVMRSAK
ncbi:MAG: serine/threonine-protein kinase [Nannocystales bacterium]